LIVCIWWEWRNPHPIVELKLLKRRNFATAMTSMAALGMVLYGLTVLLPEFLQNLMGYTAAQAGECMALGGFLMMLTMPLSGALTGKMDPRYLLAFGYMATAAGLYYVAMHLTLDMDFGTAAMLRTYQVAGLAFIFIPSNVLCYAGIPREKNNQVSSMMNFVRNIGGSIGIAVVSTMVTRETQTRQTYLAGRMQNGNPMFRQMVGGLAATLHKSGMNMADANHLAIGRLAGMLEQQAAALAFKDVIAELVIVVICLIPLAFIMRKPAGGRNVPPPH
ncbi:MAG: MFS transporter, partial [Candidatus Acidiferrales bacterium]